MNKEQLAKYLTTAMSTGADFAEIYYEERKIVDYRLIDSKLDTIDTKNEKGIGIRITKDEVSYYTSTDILTDENIIKVINKLIKNVNSSNKKTISLKKLVDKTKNVVISHDNYPIEKKKELLHKIDNIARKESKLVTQVVGRILEMDKNFIIANTTGKYIKGNNVWTRIIASVYTEKEAKKERESTNIGASSGYEILEKFNVEEEIKKITRTAVEKLDAINFKGGEMPVILCPGFGAVIFHEACGHGLEATSVAPHVSVFSDDLEKIVATKKVTLIDDGTIENAWGSSVIDDEGNETKKNVLIEKGIIKNYLVDQFNSKKMNTKLNGCGRRESYKFSATSRMSNTYLAPGNDKVEDMIKSIDYGVYCESMSGGSVNPATGDFNFSVETARLIEKGEIKHLLRGVALIGNSKDILKQVEMVSDDLKIEAGFCGSKSGTIPVTIGQPTIKISKILVGGME